MSLIMFSLPLVFLMILQLTGADGSGWDTAHATFYGDMGGSETMEGACGYGDLFKQGYGLETTALSTALFNSGLTCGACFEIQCYDDPQWCAAGSITVTATNFCPPNESKPSDDGGWCNPPRKHFDLSMPMFVKITRDYHAGIVPVRFRRVTCVRNGGMRFEIKGNQWWLLVLVYNVAGSGEVTAVSIRGNSMEWKAMTRNWGQNWQISEELQGQSLSFSVTTSDGQTVQSLNVVPANWQFGQTFEGNQV